MDFERSCEYRAQFGPLSEIGRVKANRIRTKDGRTQELLARWEVMDVVVWIWLKRFDGSLLHTYTLAQLCSVRLSY